MARSSAVMGLDLGTTKIAAVIAEPDENERLRVIGVGCSPSDGLRRGVVVNLEKTVGSIQKAVEEAEQMAGVTMDSAYVGIAGDHIRGLNSRGVIAVSRSDNEITRADVERVVEQAKAVALPMDREIVHVIPQEFVVDGQAGIKDPVGMAGVRLEAEVHIVTGAVTSAQNIYKSVERANLKVQDLVLQPLASSYAVLDSEERELGVALVDVGGGTMDIAIFFDGAIRQTGVIGLGGENVTSDIAIGLRTPRLQAERIKCQFGSALRTLVDNEEYIAVPGVGGRTDREVSRQVLAAIIEPRLEEIFGLANRELKNSDYAELLGAGVVITGGTACMDGIVPLAEQVFDLPVKVGSPVAITGLNDAVSYPSFATGVGLALFGLKNRGQRGLLGVSEAHLFDKISEKMKRWIGDFF
jgi:cell division protein FtsA